MTPLQFELQLRRHKEALGKLITRTLPVKAGTIAVQHFRDNFRQEGFVDSSLQPWKPSKRKSDPKNPDNAYKTLLSRRNSWIEDNLPEIDTIEHKIEQMSAAGYEPYAHFTLPEHCWTKNYYEPMKPAMEAFLKDHNNSVAALSFVNRLKEEIAYYEENKEYFGYVFYIGKKCR